MFTLQLPSGLPATWLLPLLGMAGLSLLACVSGLWGAKRLLDPSRQVVTTLSRRAKVACDGFSLALLLLVWVACVRVEQVAADPPTTAAASEAAAEPAVAGGNAEPAVEQGRFRLAGLDRLCEVEVEFSKPGYCPSLYPAQKTGTQVWTTVLTNDTHREGQVLSPDGQPVPGVLVRAARGPFQNPHVRIREVWTEATTDAAETPVKSTRTLTLKAGEEVEGIELVSQ